MPPCWLKIYPFNCRSDMTRTAGSFQREHADYTARLIGTLNTAAAGMGLKALLKVLVYGDGKDFSGDASSVIWLKG